MNKKGLNYPLSLMVTVIIVLPFVIVMLTTRSAETTKLIGDSQQAMLRVPYVKEDVITYLEKSAELIIPDIMSYCTIGLSQRFNQEMDKYIDAYNAKSPVTKIPKNNYELYMEGKNVHAIAILPVQKSITKRGYELDSLGTMWFAPSFTVQAPTDLSTCIV